jgi:hypothetical protein
MTVQQKMNVRTIRRMDRLSLQCAQKKSRQATNGDGLPHLRIYAVRMASDLSPEIAACAAAKRAIGTR